MSGFDPAKINPAAIILDNGKDSDNINILLIILIVIIIIILIKLN